MTKKLIRLAIEGGIWEFFVKLEDVLKEMSAEQNDPAYRKMADEIFEVFVKHFNRIGRERIP